MKIAAALACCLVVWNTTTHAAKHVWLHGTWRDVQRVAGAAGAVSIPIGGTPPTTVAGVTIQGTAPTYISIPTTSEVEYVTIDGPDNLRYVARWNRHFTNIIINDPIDFAVDGKFLYVKGLKPNQEHKLELVTTTRLQ